MNSWIEHIGWETSIALWHLPALLILSVLLLFLEISKKKPRKSLRIITLFIAIITVYVSYLSPLYKSEVAVKSVLLLGRDIPAELLDSLLQQQQYPTILQHEQSGFRLINGKLLPSLAALEYSIDTLFAVGHFQHFNPSHFNYLKRLSINEDGFQLQFPTSIQLGDSLKVNISHPDGIDNSLGVIFNRDSLMIQASRSEQSTIAYLPKQKGPVMVNIVKDSIQQLYFSVEVKAPDRYRIMLMAAVPDFEWRFLANHLMDEGHAVYQYTQISKNKYKSAFFNWPDSVAIQRAVPNQLDMLIVDAKAWNDLGSLNKQQYINILNENGGSLIIRSNPNTKIQLNLDESKLANIFSSGDNLIELNQLKHLSIREIKGFEEVSKNQLFRKVNANTVVGIINFQNSYQLKLAGDLKRFRQLWNQVLSEFKLNRTGHYNLQASWPVQFQPFQIQMWSSNKMDTILVVSPQQDTVSISSIADRVYPERKHFLYYPTQAGWYYWKLKNQTEYYPFYVNSIEQSSSSIFLDAYEYQYNRQLNSWKEENEKLSIKYKAESLTIWFFILFLVSIGVLWIEDKIN